MPIGRQGQAIVGLEQAGTGTVDMYVLIGQMQMETLGHGKQIHIMHLVKPETHGRLRERVRVWMRFYIPLVRVKLALAVGINEFTPLTAFNCNRGRDRYGSFPQEVSTETLTIPCEPTLEHIFCICLSCG
jgi:hypothetical protein